MSFSVPTRVLHLVTAVVLAATVFACAVPAPAPTAVPRTPTTAPPTATAATTATPTVAPSPLSGVWQLVRFEYMSGKTVNEDQPDRYTLEFLSDGKVRVKADCNSGTGTYTVSGDRLAIENVGLTKMACAAGSPSDQFVQGLSNAISYVLDGAELTISMRYDAGEMVFARGK